MKRPLIIFVVLLFSALSYSQTANFKAAEKFRSSNLNQKAGDLNVRANWIHETNKFWYSYKKSDGKNYYYVDADAKSKKLLFDSRYMASQIHKLIHRPYNQLDLPISDIEFEKESTTKFTFKIDSIRFLYNMTDRNLLIKDTVPDEDRNDRWASYSPDSTWIAYAKNHNLFIMKANDPDSVEVQLTTDGELHYG
jgi:hypothetical protein